MMTNDSAGRDDTQTTRDNPRAAGAASDRGAQPPGQRPPSSLFDQRTGVCANCRKPIFRRSAGGEWYHRRSVSTSCYPGSGSWKQATPRETE